MQIDIRVHTNIGKKNRVQTRKEKERKRAYEQTGYLYITSFEYDLLSICGRILDLARGVELERKISQAS